jgi:zinc transport system permease protein
VEQLNLWYSIVDLLPFEWAQPGSMFFMKNALLAVLVISPLFGLLSTMVVESRMSFFSDALGHSAFTGIAIGTLLGSTVTLFSGADPMWFAVLFAVVFALLFTFVRKRTSLASDTVIGVFSSTAVALGIFIATLGGGSFTKFNALLIGDILSVEPRKIGLLAGILALVVVLWVCSFNQLMLASVHPALADSRGIQVFWQEALFSAAIAVVVTISMTWVGLLVINSLLVLPGAAARNVSRNMRQYHLVSLLSAVCAGIAGLMTSYYIEASAGAAITLYLAIFFAVTFCFRKQRL